MNNFFSLQLRFLTVLFLSAPAILLSGQEPVYILPDTLPPTDSMSYEQLTAVGIQLQRQADLLVAFHIEKTAPLQQTREAFEAALDLARQDTTIGKDSLKTLQKSLKVAKSREKEALREQQKAEQSAQNARALAETTDTATLRMQIPNVFKEIQKVAALSRRPVPVEPPVANVIGPVTINDEAPPAVSTEPSETMPDSISTLSDKPDKGKRKPVEPPTKKIKSYDPVADVMFNPPTPPCRLAVERRDAFSGERYRETAPAELFRFTNEVMKKILEGRTHIRCDAALVGAGAKTMLRLQFSINDPNARKTFGGLAQGSMAVLKFIDGSTHTLYNSRPDNGTLNPESGIFSYLGQYELDAATQKKIAAQELDKLRIAWMTGYEDYDIYLVDVLMRQMQCLTTQKP